MRLYTPTSVTRARDILLTPGSDPRASAHARRPPASDGVACELSAGRLPPSEKANCRLCFVGALAQLMGQMAQCKQLRRGPADRQPGVEAAVRYREMLSTWQELVGYMTLS